jgi:hypothetical protein
METDFRYGAVFCEGAGTGKTVVLEIVREVFPGYFVNILPEVLVHKGPGEKIASPYISELENKGAGIVGEWLKGSRINTTLLSLFIRHGRCGQGTAPYHPLYKKT